jgi:acyl-CoA synthetase (AMP-forming)/AMP-acid ligase II
VSQSTGALQELLAGLLETGRSGTALATPEDGRELTYERLQIDVIELAGRLRWLGIERGDRLAMVVPNGPEIVELVFASSALGVAAAPLNPAYTESEFRFYLEDLQPRAVILPSGRADAARLAAGSIPIIEFIVGEEAHLKLVQDGRDVESTAPFDPGLPDDVALLLHTSGTTSRPKQVPLLQRNLVATARSIATHYALSDADVSMCAMPLFHVHGLVGSTLAALASGGTVVTPRRFAPSRFWRDAIRYDVSWFSAGPTTHQKILESGGSALPKLRFVRSCSSPLSPAVLDRIESTFGVPALEAYGMTEASHQMTSNPIPPAPRRPGTVGVPAGADVRIVDATWRDVPDGGEGEVVIRGPGVTPGYLNDPEANERSFLDGWFRTGDQGVIEAGYLRLLGRLKEMIIRGGENISPYEVEDVINAHPAVSDAVCFGVDDEKYGQRVGAAVTLQAEVTVEELRAHCRRSLAAFKVPDTIHILEDMPRTSTGKVQRRLIAAELEGPEG